MNVNIATMAVKKLEKLKDLLTKTVQENKQLKSDNCNWLNFKKIWLKSWKKKKKKKEGEYKGLTKDINSVRAVTNNLASSLGEEGTKTIEDLKEINGSYWGREHKLFNEKI